MAQLFEELEVPTSPSQVLITNGAQQAIWLLAYHYLREPGSTALAETPSYFGALDVFRHFGARLTGVPVGPEGIDAEEFGSAVSERRPDIAYLIPTFQHPTGTVMGADARRIVVEHAENLGIPLVDDMALAFVSLQRGATIPPPLAHYASADSIVTIGSMSKMWWAGLRVGWIRGSESLVTELTQLKTRADLGTPVIDQLISLELLNASESLLRPRVDELLKQRDSLVDALRTYLPSWTFDIPTGGLSLWIQLPSGDASEFAQVAEQEGVAIISGPAFCVAREHPMALRLPFALEPAILEIAVRRLARAWSKYQGLTSADKSNSLIV